jgi:hypothetical protein
LFGCKFFFLDFIAKGFVGGKIGHGRYVTQASEGGRRRATAAKDTAEEN